MATEIRIGLPEYGSAAEVAASKPWLTNIRPDAGGWWVGFDPEQGKEVIAGRMSNAAIIAMGMGGYGGSTGLANYSLTKQGQFYDASGSSVSASLFGAGVVPLPGLGLFSDPRMKWLVVALLLAGVVLVASRGKAKGFRLRRA